jgi:hypothetical protein
MQFSPFCFDVGHRRSLEWWVILVTVGGALATGLLLSFLGHPAQDASAEAHDSTAG